MAFRSPLFLAVATIALVAETSAQMRTTRDFEALLPNAPSTSLSARDADAAGAARISGQPVDVSGAAIEKCAVVLLDESNHALKETECGTRGLFSFDNLSAGTFKVVITAPGFSAYDSGPVTVSTEQNLELPTITLAIESANTEVQVRAYDHAIAEAQMKAAEKQRVLGIIPNFYTSFEYDAVPLTAGQKFRLATRATLDPFHFVASGIVAGVQQARNTYPDFGDDAEGYGKRYGAAFGLSLASDMLNHAVFPSIFKQDPRYFYQGSGSTASRLWHAVSFAIILRNDSGKMAPNYSYILGGLTTGALSNAIYPSRDRGAALLFENAGISIGSRAVRGIVREFLAGSITTHRAGKGKPAPLPVGSKP